LYHPLLDWRLALDMARLATNENAPIDLHTDWILDGKPYPNPWRRLIEGTNNPVTRLLSDLGYKSEGAVNDLLVFSKPDVAPDRILILRHPLWNDDHPDFVAAKMQVAAQFASASTIEAANPLRVLRQVVKYLTP
jgi:hypothetical protein